MLKPETALDSWREWDASLDTRPVVISPLGGGRSNQSFLLGSGGGKMVLRINALATALPNPNRNVETRVWRAASEAGIAPQLLYAEPGGEFLVSTFVENDLPRHPQHDSNLAVKALGLLQRCHQLAVDVPEIDYAAHIERYWQVIESQDISLDPKLAAQRDPMNELLEEICSDGAKKGLCHHDPVVENFVGTPERLYLIDWEYAARGLHVMDYAALVEEWGVEDHIVCQQAGVAPKILAQARSFYRYLCNLWETAGTT